MSVVFGIYKARTPGVQAADNITVILSDQSEPQPDLLLRIVPEAGGQSRTNDQSYVIGPPELVVEVSHASRSIDMHAKRRVYRDAGVREYLVLLIEEQRLVWLDLEQNIEREPDADGITRSRIFPGLWIDGSAVLAGDTQRSIAVLEQGLATAEHQAFAAMLAQKLSRS